jgi:hypothetical protein
MKEHGRSILTVVSLAAILVATLVLASNLLAPYLGGQNIVPKSFAFALVQGGNDSANGAVAVMVSTLSPKFMFSNVTFGNGMEEDLETTQARAEYDATWLKWIGIRPKTIVCQPEQLPFNGSYSLTIAMNTTINASLDVENIDLGTYSSWNESYLICQNDLYSHTLNLGTATWNGSGCWERGWYPEDTMCVMKTEELSGMLHGSGTALIIFHGVVDLKLDYEITMNGVKKTGVKTLSCEGNLGTVEVTYNDQNKPIWTKFEIQTMQLVMLAISE